MRKSFTIEELKQSACAKLNEHLFVEKEKPKKQKHNNVITEFDGYVFRSKKELGRYIVLRSKQGAGEIKDLALQVPFELNEDGSHSVTYVADFCYVVVKTGEYITEDTKGHLTALYKKKRGLMKKILNIEIKEL